MGQSDKHNEQGLWKNKIRTLTDEIGQQLGRLRKYADQLFSRIPLQYRQWFYKGRYGMAILALVAVPIWMVANHQTVAALEFNAADFKELPTFDPTKLRIIQMTPQGKVYTDQYKKEVVVVFSHPMVPLSTLDDQDNLNVKQAFAITPAVPGKFRWYGSRAAAFVPSEPLRPGTKYTVRVNGSLKDLKNRVLGETQYFYFETEQLRLTSKYPSSGLIDYKRSINLYFNYKVDLASAQKYIRIKAAGKNWPVSIQHGGSAAKPIRRRIVLKPITPYPRNAEVIVQIGPGLRPTGAKTPGKMSESFSLKTYGPMDVALNNSGRFYQNYYPSLRFTNPLDLSKSKGKITVVKVTEKGEEKALKYNGTAKGYSSYLYLNNWPLEPERRYRVKIDPLIVDRYGNKYIGAKQFQFKSPSVRQEFSFTTGLRHIESAESTKIPISIAGIPQLELKIGTFGLKDVLNYISGNTEKIVSEPIETVYWDSGYTPRQLGLAGMDLKPYFDQDQWLHFTLSGTKQNWKGENQQSSRTLSLIRSDFGIIVKEDYKNSHLWLHSLSTGEAVTDAEVTGYSETDDFDSCTTNEDGYCRLTHDNNSLMPHTTYYVEKDGQRSLVNSRNNKFYYWSINATYSEKAAGPAFTAQAEFDRRLYRPGETMHWKALTGIYELGRLRTDEDALGSIQVKIFNSRGKEIHTEQRPVSEAGGAYSQFTIPEDTPLGHYQLRLSSSRLADLDGNEYRTNSYVQTFQVEEFKPVSFTVETKGLTSTTVGAPQNLTINARYLYGAPMQKAPYSYNISRRPAYPTFTGYESYSVGDYEYGYYWEPSSWSSVHTGNGKLNQKGSYSFQYIPERLKPNGDDSGTLSQSYQLEFDAKVKDIDDRQVSNTTKTTIYADSLLPGLNVQDRYHSVKKPFVFNIMLLDPKKKVPQPGQVEVIIHQKIWKSIKTKSAGGSVQTKNTLIRKEVQREQIAVGKTGAQYSYKAQDGGNYTITIRYGQAYSRQNFYAFGEQYIGWDFSSDDRVDLVADKAEYKIGETAKILVKSPYKKAKAVISVERESLYWQKTIELGGAGKPIEIPIKQNYLPNVYVNIVVIRPRNKAISAAKQKEDPHIDFGKPEIKLGSLQLKVNTSAKRLPLSISTNKKNYKPGEEMSLTISTAPGAEVALSIADRAILDLINYRYGDPLKSFYKDLPLGVRILENRGVLIRQLTYANKGRSPGGKAMDSAALAQKGGFSEDAEDGARRNFKKTALWKPALIANAQGKINLNLKLPDNLTTFRLQALAGHEGRYNRHIGEIKVRKPVLIQPSLPRIIRPEDQVEVSAVVHNRTNTSLNVKVEFLASGNLTKFPGGSQTSQLINVPPDSNSEVTTKIRLNLKQYFALKQELRAKSKPYPTEGFQLKGKIKVTTINSDQLMAQGYSLSDINDSMPFAIDVRDIPIPEAFTLAGFVEDSQETEYFLIPSKKGIFANVGGLDVHASSTVLGGLENGFSFFHSNPQFCLEQRASAYQLALSAGSLLREFQVRSSDPRGYDFSQTTQLFVGELNEFQNADGGFRAWKDDNGSPSNPYLTAYVLQVLSNAKMIVNTMGVDGTNGANGTSGADDAEDADSTDDADDAGTGSLEVPSAVINQALNYLETFIQKPPRYGMKYILESFAAINYTLGLYDRYNSGLHSLLEEHYDRLSLRAKAYLALAHGRQESHDDYKDSDLLRKVYQQLNNSMEFTTRRIRFRDISPGSLHQAWYSDGTVMGALLQFFMQFDAKNPLISKMVRHTLADHSRVWYSSHDSGQLAYSLWKYHRTYEKTIKTTGEFSLGKIKQKIEIDGLKPFKFTVKMPSLLNQGPAGQTLDMLFGKESGGRLYYTAALNYAPRFKKAKARDEGIEVRREIIPTSNSANGVLQADPSGRYVFTRGEVYLCRLTVVNPKPVFDFLLEDPIPATMEAVNTRFKTESSQYSRILTKKKSKNDWSWWSGKPITELRDDRYMLVEKYLRPGIHEYYYLIRATNRGQSLYLPVQAKAMYEPEMFGRGRQALAVVQ